IKKMSAEEFDSVVRVNLTGTFNCIQKAAPILRNGGRIVNLSSVSGQMGLFGQANYASSKAAIIALTKVSAREFAGQNITVNAIVLLCGCAAPEEGYGSNVERVVEVSPTPRPTPTPSLFDHSLDSTGRRLTPRSGP